MSDQIFRSAKTPQGIVIFPFPPIKDQKWLIKVESLEIAKELILKLTNKVIPTPLNDQDEKYYLSDGLHSDGQTPLYLLKDENFHS